MNVTPIGDRVLVMPARADMRSPGGIVLSATPQNVPEQGVVVAVGPEVNGVHAGQRVVYAKGKYPTTRIFDRELTVLRDGDLLAVVED